MRQESNTQKQPTGQEVICLNHYPKMNKKMVLHEERRLEHWQTMHPRLL